MIEDTQSIPKAVFFFFSFYTPCLQHPGVLLFPIPLVEDRLDRGAGQRLGRIPLQQPSPPPPPGPVGCSDMPVVQQPQVILAVRPGPLELNGAGGRWQPLSLFRYHPVAVLAPALVAAHLRQVDDPPAKPGALRSQSRPHLLQVHLPLLVHRSRSCGSCVVLGRAAVPVQAVVVVAGVLATCWRDNHSLLTSAVAASAAAAVHCTQRHLPLGGVIQSLQVGAGSFLNKRCVSFIRREMFWSKS